MMKKKTCPGSLLWGIALLSALVGCNDGGGDGRASNSAGAASVTNSHSASSCGKSSWVAGITELCGGHLVYRDYIYDDYGADLGIISPPGVLLNLSTRPPSPGATQPANLSPSAGDQTYPEGAGNTADLVRLELWIEDDQLLIEFELNTLFEPGQTTAVLAIDTDNNEETGGGDWPGLGIRSTGWELQESFTIGDPETNLITGRIPLPEGDVWRLQAVLAQADGTVMNVAFRGPDEVSGAVPALSTGFSYYDPAKGGWWEDRQAAALAAGDISEFGYVVQLADLRKGVTRAAEVGPGLHERVYTSAYTVGAGEGVSMEGEPGIHGDSGSLCEQYFHFLGKYQPYAIYIPSGQGPHSLQLQLHGCGDNHASQMNEPGFQARFGDGPNRIIVSPLGRGPQGYFHHLAERDWLDVLNDSVDAYDVDEDQLFVSGTSMGGYGALRAAALYPDRFAGLINWVGFTGNVLNTSSPGNVPAELLQAMSDSPSNSTGSSPNSGGDINVIDFVQNLRHVPSVHLYSSADELVHVHTGLAMIMAFDAAELEHHSYMHTPAEHLTYVFLDDWQKEANYILGRKLKKNPARVTYKADSISEAPEYGIFHDRAYWVSDIRERVEGVSEVDLTSQGCGRDYPVFSAGYDAGIGPAPLTWVRAFRDLGGAEPGLRLNRLEGRLDNVASLSIDVIASCLTTGTAYMIETDGPVAVSLSDGRVLNLRGAGVHEGVI